MTKGVRADFKCSYRKLEQFAAHVRKTLGFDLDAQINALRLFEDLDDISSSYNGTSIALRGYIQETEDSEGFARYNQMRNIIEINASPQTYTWIKQQHPRGTYFLAHELGHGLLHTAQLVRLAQLPTTQQTAFHRGKSDHKAFEDTEWQANAFASALLMPAAGLVKVEARFGYLSASTIATVFGVSREAASYRLQLFSDRREQLL